MNIRLSMVAAALAAGLPCAPQAWANQDVTADAVVVSATRISVADTDAPYASEVHGREQIERSGATTLIDYLSRHTSLQVQPNFGNRHMPSINMRGYGINDGHQNVVVSVDGRRLNNIDMVPQLLGAIMLADVDRIEITRGSGSVLFGDGATAGTIQIYTRPRDGASVEAFAGSHGLRGGALSAGLVREHFSLSASAERSAADGFSRKDPSGHRDESSAETWRVAASGRPADDLKLDLEAGRSRIDTRYPNPLTLAQFRKDPRQNTATSWGEFRYNHQKFDTRHWGLGVEYDLTPEWRVSARHHDEDKASEFVLYDSVYDYRYRTDELALHYDGERFSALAGLQRADGARKGSADKTTKRNTAGFVHGQYEFDSVTVSAGLRSERVEYVYRSGFGGRLKDDEDLRSWDVGVNYRFDPALSVFANYNASQQAPDIDRFFMFDWNTFSTSFNGFIEPARVRTLTLGLNHVTAANRLKLAVFHARLKNEIYYFDTGNFLTSFNTNIDRSHKYGLELQDTWQISERFTGVLNYAWTRARIDREDEGGGAFNGKDLPGVPRHSLVLGLNVKVADKGNLYLSHTWRSKAWAADDFDNNNAQRQRAYQSTDLSYRHRLSRELEVYGAVGNLFERRNGMWVGDDRIYPVDFERTWKLGARLSF